MTTEVVLWQILLRSKARLFQKTGLGSFSGKYLRNERVNVRVNTRNKPNEELQKKISIVFLVKQVALAIISNEGPT